MIFSLFFKLNSAKYSPPKLTAAALESLKKLNWADFNLYEMMNRRLDREKETIGSAKVDQLAAEIENRNRQLVEECTNTKVEAANFQLTPETKKNQTCVMTTKDQTLMIQVISSYC